LTLFILVLGTSIYIPAGRFLPSYHPKALEGLVYIFLSFLEFGLIAFFLILGAAVGFLREEPPDVQR